MDLVKQQREGPVPCGQAGCGDEVDVGLLGSLLVGLDEGQHSLHWLKLAVGRR